MRQHAREHPVGVTRGSVIIDAIEHGHTHELPSSGILRERGRRLTVQRAAIWDVLTAEPDLHLAAETVAERVREQLPQVNPSTVYRTLDVLVDEGLVLRTDLGDERAYFEPTHEHRHHHLVCESCGRVQHVHDEAFATIGERVERSSGFRLGERELTLFGTCAACVARRPRLHSTNDETERTR